MSNIEAFKADIYSLVLENSYSFYLSIKVAAAIMERNYQYIKGVNVENTDYSLTICDKNTIY